MFVITDTVKWVDTCLSFSGPRNNNQKVMIVKCSMICNWETTRHSRMNAIMAYRIQSYRKRR